ncbi:FAD-dependent monooxygenase [Bradyrhizobium elkanii]|uniref:FAD-dependent monooxygenase n=1 Tax=Bradyrhizobium elkanii TaxID=29448 RepID=UPI001AE3DD31|nr:FAD-dependent monooxygenase [Bradyrhizobium elkanii]WLA88935.1 FAD-dependent monooxygenase [Bradyrhizobium elkanii]
MTSEHSNRELPVVIVGAGPAGLSLAIELGRRSIPCVLIERNDRAGVAPRAKLTNVRTREHLRRWGIADRLRDASPLGVDYPANVIFVTKLAGPLITRFEDTYSCQPASNPLYSEHAQWIPQYKLETTLLEHVSTLPCVEILMGIEVVSFEQNEFSVNVRIRDVATHAERVISAVFMVGADGARSTIREMSAIEMVGTYGLSNNYNTIFEAPGLDQAHPHGPAIQYWQVNADVPSTMGPMDVGDRWFFMPMGLAMGGRFTDEEMPDVIRRATGIDLPYRILSSDAWVASRLLAARYRSGRVFLVGDACHLHPPFGGHGMNMGVGDSVDLGWKLAAVLQGWGDPALLDSYEAERRRVHERVMDDTEINHKTAPNQLVRAGIEEDSVAGEAVRADVARLVREVKPREFYGLNLVLGYSYFGSSIIVRDEDDPTEWVPGREYIPSARAGSLAPHQWLADGSSLYDKFGDGFTMLVLDPASRTEAAEAAEQADAAGIPFDAIEFDDPVLRALYGAPLALIRPDQHVAWRGDAVPTDLLKTVTGHHTSLTGEAK